jgi:type VI secretion system protein VasG
MIDAILTNTMLPELSIALLQRQMAGETVAKIDVKVKDSVFDYTFSGPDAAAAPAQAAPEPVNA